MTKLDVFLIEKADVYRRLIQAYGEAHEHFLMQLATSLHAMVKDLLGETWSDRFGDDWFATGRAGYAFCEDWKLESPEELQHWRHYPAFWFPKENPQMAMFSLLGITEGSEVSACIWPQPISGFLNDLAWPRTEWEKAVNVPLRKKGWLSYGDRITNPQYDWGTHLPIRLNHLEVAKGMEAGDLRPALEPIEKALEDFKSVRGAIQDIIQKARSRKTESSEYKDS